MTDRNALALELEEAIEANIDIGLKIGEGSFDMNIKALGSICADIALRHIAAERAEALEELKTWAMEIAELRPKNRWGKGYQDATKKVLSLLDSSMTDISNDQKKAMIS